MHPFPHRDHRDTRDALDARSADPADLPIADAPEPRVEEAPVETLDPNSVEARALRFDFFARHPMGHPQAGEHVERTRVCDCGREYSQYRLSEKVHEIAALKGSAARHALARATPDGFVPTQCPACESRALGEGRTAVRGDAPPPAQETLEL